MKSYIKAAVISFEALKGFILTIMRFIGWCFTNKFSAVVFIIALSSLISWCVGFFLFVGNIDQSREEIFADSPNINDKTQAIVVLTGGSERIRHAIYLLNQGYADKLFISGVNPEVKLNELLAIHGYDLVQQEILKDKIELGYQADDTLENAKEIADWVKGNNFSSIRLVTSNYHMKRAMFELQHEIPGVKIIPHGVVPLNIRVDRWWEFSSTRDLLISEYNKYLLANFRIFLENLGF